MSSSSRAKPSSTVPPASAPAAGVHARWQLRLLGGFALGDGRGSITRLPTRAITLLLARLAMDGARERGREELIELLWPEVALDVGRNRLRQALSVLRGVLEPAAWPGAAVLLADRRTVRLAPGAVACDTEALRLAVQAGDRAAVLRLYGGELLPGYFDEWVLEERRHLAALVESLADVAAPVAGVPGYGPAFMPGIKSDFTTDFTADFTPTHTPTHAPAAAPVAAAGLPLRQPVPDEPRHRLPLYLSRLLGFEAAAASLAAAVRSQRLVVLRGPGGAGKTRLAVEVASAFGPDAFDTVSFVPLVACTTRAALLDAVLLALRQEDASADGDASARVERALAGRRALLVLDNFEQLVEAGRSDVAHWLASLPQLHLLVTSRRVLGLDGEHEQALQALPLPAADAPLVEVAANPAAALFADRARAVRADFHLGERNHALVAAIVTELHGLPLAIELAAARLRSLSLLDMLQMLRGGAAQQPAGGSLALLARSGPRGSDDARHASMLRVVEWGWQLLSEAERQALAALAAFDGGARLQVLAAVLRQEPTGAALLLDALVASSVAHATEGSGGHSRFHAFEPVREYVRLQRGAAGREQLALAHLQGMAAWAAALGPAPALDEFRDELPNLLLALKTAADQQQGETALRLALDCEAALEDVALPPSGLDALRRALAGYEDQVGHDAALAAAAHGLLAERSFEAGQREAAVDHARAALLRLPPDSPRAPAVQYAAARIALRVQADNARAQALIALALPRAQALGQRAVQARLLTLQAVIAVRVDHDLARDIALKQQALALWQACGAPARVAGATVSLAISLGFAHRPLDQLPLLQWVRQAAAAQGQRSLLAFALSVQGYVLADLRRWEASAASFRECLAVAWDVAAWREWFYGLWNLPRTLAHQRRPEAAARLMGFADTFYSQRFGTLGWEDARERRRTRRLVRVQLGREREAQLWQQGQLMTMTEARALAQGEGHAPMPSPSHSAAGSVQDPPG